MPYRQNTFLPIHNKIFLIEHIRELAELLFDEYDRKNNTIAKEWNSPSSAMTTHRLFLMT